MELYHNNMSVCAQKVRLVIAEKCLRPTEHHMLLRNGDTHTPEYLALNPKGVVPTLLDRACVITESTIICEYLEEAYPQIRMMPTDPVGRARVRIWTQLPDAGLHAACGHVSVAIAWRHQIKAAGGEQMNRAKSKAGPPSPFLDIVENGTASQYFAPAIFAYDQAVAAMALALEGQDWLAGNSYSMADAALLPYIIRLEHLALDWLWAGKCNKVADWLERSRKRSNYTAISDYLEPSYVDLAKNEGSRVSGQVRTILAS